ncbi:hypothetical protein GCM10027346_19190 [Hymenobacter seoulensis]
MLLSAAVKVQAQANDGFQRRDGSMFTVRNGEARLLTRDVRLPNGRLITRDGFVVSRDGQRTELKDGQGCSLLGEPVAVSKQDDGRLLLGARSSVTPASAAQNAWGQRWKGRGKGKGHGKNKWKRKHDD